MTEIILLSIILALLIVLVIARFTRSRHIRELEKSVTLKKLQLSEKILDSQINGNPNLTEFIEQQASRQKEIKEDSKPIGYAR